MKIQIYLNKGFDIFYCKLIWNIKLNLKFYLVNNLSNKTFNNLYFKYILSIKKI